MSGVRQESKRVLGNKNKLNYEEKAANILCIFCNIFLLSYFISPDSEKKLVVWFYNIPTYVELFNAEYSLRIIIWFQINIPI